MLKPQAQVFANLITQLHRDLPLEPLTRLVNLAAVAVGILGSKSLQLGQIVTALPLDGSRATRQQRVQRFGKNAGVTVEPYSEPLARRILQRLAAGGAQMHLTGDRPEWGDFNILDVWVGWRGRALPLLGSRLGRGAWSFAEQKARLEVSATWLPKGAQGLLLGDRECGTGALAQGALQPGWDLCLRLRAHGEVRRAGARPFARLPLLLPGERRVWPHVAFTHHHQVSGRTRAMYGAPRAAEPWDLLTTAPTGKLACASSAKRCRSEAMCKEFKNNGRGCGLDLPGARHADRGARLWLALALLYTWLLWWGAYVMATGPQQLVANVRKPTLSLFQTGLRFVLRLGQRGQWRTFHWHLSMLTEAHD